MLSHGLSHCKEAEIPSSPDRVSGQSRQPDRNSSAGSGSCRQSRSPLVASALTALAQTLVEIGLATESDWIAAGKFPPRWLIQYFAAFSATTAKRPSQSTLSLPDARRINRRQQLFGDSEPIPMDNSFLFSIPSHPFRLGHWQSDHRTGGRHPGMGAAFYDTLRQALIPLDPGL